MRTLFKYLLPFVLFFLALIFFFAYTKIGQKSIYTLASTYLSNKSGMNIKVNDMTIQKYPYIESKVTINKLYSVKLNGFVKNKQLDVDYHLDSKCFKNDICRFDDTIAIQGKMTGWFNHLYIKGAGAAIDGNITYRFEKEKNRFSNIDLQLKDVNASKLAIMLEQEAFFKGKANARLHFDLIEEKHKKGRIAYDVNTSRFYGMPAHFQTHIDVKDDKHTFTMKVTTTDATLSLDKGIYVQSEKYAHAMFNLDIKELHHFNKILGNTLKGPLHAIGDIAYDKTILIKGSSSNWDGNLSFIYNSETLELFLKNISFEKLMHTLHTQPLLQAKVNGYGVYDLKKREMTLKSKLNHAKLYPSGLTHVIEKKLHYPIENEIFDQSSFSLHYKNNHILASDFILANNNQYIKLTNTKLNPSYNTIDTSLHLHTLEHDVEGKLYLRLNNINQKNLDDAYLIFDGNIEKHYALKLEGLLSNDLVNLDYAVHAARVPSFYCTIVDDVNVSGHLSGAYDHLHLIGKGRVMEGNVSFSGIKMKNHYEDVSLDFTKIHALKLFTLLGQPTLPTGKADIHTHFDYIYDTQKQKGNIRYTLTKGTYETLPLEGQIKATIKDNNITFDGDASLATAQINISQGKIDVNHKSSKALYMIQTKDLLALKPLIGTYRGAFSSTGKITYGKDIQIRGLSHTFGGMIDYLYKKNVLYIDLENVSLKRILGLYDAPKILDATANGNINFDAIQKKFLVDADLNNTRFLDSDLVQTVFKTSGVNMLKERFTKSKLKASYQNKILKGKLLLQNKKSHFFLKHTHINTEKNRINALFDLRMQGEAFSGKVYGALNNPKVNLNMKKLIRYQMDKKLDSVIGKGNRKLMEAIPMGGAAKDMASEVGGEFLDMFF